MAWITFNRIYAGLIIVAVVSAMILPKPFSDRARAQIQRAFMPITYPIHTVASIAARRISPQLPDVEQARGGPRTYQEIADENRDLRMEVAHLTAQLQKLQEINADRAAIGPIREHCRPLQVDGMDPGLRRALTLRGPISGMRAGMAVLHSSGMVGRLDRVGWSGGAQVQLVTDQGFRITARFGRFGSTDARGRFVDVGSFTTLVEGDGKHGMVCRILAMKQVTDAGLKVGDWAVVADNDYPPILQGYKLGQVAAIGASRATPAVAEITIRPPENLLTLREVMVLVQ
jgi:cell shape-determining protein MreC